MTRAESDYAFYWWMKSDPSVKSWKRIGYYAVVRALGWKPWRDNKPHIHTARYYAQVIPSHTTDEPITDDPVPA